MKGKLSRGDALDLIAVLGSLAFILDAQFDLLPLASWQMKVSLAHVGNHIGPSTGGVGAVRPGASVALLTCVHAHMIHQRPHATETQAT